MKDKLKKRKRRFYLVLLFLLFAGVGAFFANRFVKGKGYANLWDFITTVSSNYNSSFDAQYKTIQINFSDNDFKKLEAQRERALERGLIVNEEGSYVPAEISCNGEIANAKIRLKGHMTDHLQKNKWSFRVKTDKKDALLGMKRFTLQHPGTRNYVYEWIYHRMMESQGILALRYDFVRLFVNGEDWGIYALEEHFGQELIQHNHHMEGPVIRFNPELYWVYRQNELEGIKIDEEYAQMQSSFIEPYDTKNTLKDKNLKRVFENAMQRMEGFRRGDLSTAEVFDIEKLAKFHAIIDIVGGHHSLDWSDVKYYFNSETQLLEPVSYESFSIRPTRSLAGSHKFTNGKKQFGNDLHAQLFNDTEFFAAYIRALSQLATTEWLDQFFEKNNPEIQTHLKTLYKEFPYKNYDTKAYYDNCASIQKLIACPIAIYAHVDHETTDSLYISVGGTDALPYQLIALIDDSISLPFTKSAITSAKLPNQPVNYQTYAFHYRKQKGSKLKINYSLLGSDKVLSQKVFDYPAYNKEIAQSAYMSQAANVKDFSFLKIDEDNKWIHTLPGHHRIEKDLILPEGYIWKITEGITLDILNGSKIISRAALEWSGKEDAPIRIFSSDKTGQGIVLQSAQTNNRLSYVYFSDLNKVQNENFEHGAVFNSYQSKLNFENCLFENTSTNGMQLVKCQVNLNACSFRACKKDALRCFYSNVALQNVSLSEVGDDGLVLTNSTAKIARLLAKNIKGKSLWIREFSNVAIDHLTIKNATTALDVQDASTVTCKTLVIDGAELGIKVHQSGDVFGPAKLTIKQLTQSAVKNKSIVEEQSKLSIEEEL